MFWFHPSATRHMSGLGIIYSVSLSWSKNLIILKKNQSLFCVHLHKRQNTLVWRVWRKPKCLAWAFFKNLLSWDCQEEMRNKKTMLPTHLNHKHTCFLQSLAASNISGNAANPKFYWYQEILHANSGHRPQAGHAILGVSLALWASFSLSVKWKQWSQFCNVSRIM